METETTQISIKTAIENMQENWLEGKKWRGRWKSVRASGIDDPCNRRLYYYMTCGELAEEFNTELIAIFNEGIDQEPGVRRFLSELGFEVKKASFTESMERYNISGSIDGTIEYGGNRYIVEIKTVSEYAWKSLQTIEDFTEGYYRKWFGQLQTYMLMMNYDKGVFILKRKQAKQVRIIEVDLDYGYAEGLLNKAETVNKAIQAETPPDFLKSNPVECRRCPFFEKVCNPPLDFSGSFQNIEDIELEKKLERREELSTGRSEYEKLDKAVKERVRDIPFAICGNFSIIGKESTVERKATEAKTIKVWKTKIEVIDNKADEKV